MPTTLRRWMKSTIQTRITAIRMIKQMAQSTVYDASNRTDACVQTGSDSFTDLNSRIQNIENKLLKK